MKKFFILCLMAFVMCSCINYTTTPLSKEELKTNARIEIRVNEDMSQYEHMQQWRQSCYRERHSFRKGYSFSDTFPYNIEFGKTYYCYGQWEGELKAKPCIFNWISFNDFGGVEVCCSVTYDNKTHIHTDFFGKYKVFETTQDLGIWVENGSPTYMVHCGTLGDYITRYIKLTYTETNCHFKDDGYEYTIYPSYSFTQDGVKCSEVYINYVYYKDNKLHIICSRKYGTEEECRKGTLGEMGLVK